VEGILDGRIWAADPWESVSIETLKRTHSDIAADLSGKSEKVYPRDKVLPIDIFQSSSTELSHYNDLSLDLIITDPPFGGLLHYSELSDFFYVWLRLVLKEKYPENFLSEHTPKSMEAVSNRAREPEDPDAFYQRLLTQCWKEAHRTLKPGGILAFTFHHSEDEGFVTLPTEEREGSATLEISSSSDRLAPRIHRRGAEGAVRCSGGEVALDVEGVEDGGMSGEKSLC
jgi:adenine-specific DNA methylase